MTEGSPNELTPTNQELSLLIHGDMTEYFNRQLAEGVSLTTLAGGVGTALARLLSQQDDSATAAKWFSTMAEMIAAGDF